jgi:hypothetical protein
MPVTALLVPVLAQQHSVVARSQARRLGVDRKALLRSVRRGELVELSPEVLALAGAPDTLERRILAAILDCGPGSFATLDTAFALWGLPGFRAEPVHVITTRRRRSRATYLAGSVHTSTFLPIGHTTVLRGIPVVSPTRALFDASGRLHPLHLERTIDNCWARNLTSGPTLHAMFDELRRQGRPRIAKMRELLSVRGSDYVPPESGLEARFQEICRQAGLPPLRRQVDTGDGVHWLGRMDFRAEHLPVVARVQSELHHTSLVDRTADELQKQRLERAGYVVASIWQSDVWHDRTTVVEQMRAAFRAAEQAKRTKVA